MGLLGKHIPSGRRGTPPSRASHKPHARRNIFPLCGFMQNRHRTQAITLACLLTVSQFLGVPAHRTNAEEVTLKQPVVNGDTVLEDFVCFGRYEQEPSFEPAPVKWRILSIEAAEDGTREAVVMSDRLLSAEEFHDTSQTPNIAAYAVSWEKSDLRTWLNNSFYGEAFDPEERKLIRTSTVVTESADSMHRRTETEDRIYLLSKEEASDPAYGFDGTSDACASRSVSRTTDFAWFQNRDCYGGDNAVNADRLGWWLRTPVTVDEQQKHINAVSYVTPAGEITETAIDDGHVARCIRPVMKIDLTSSLIRDAGEVLSDGTETSLEDGYHAPATQDGVTTWDCIYLGSYRQDAFYQRSLLRWNVLSVDGDTATLISDSILHMMPFQSADSSTKWESSPIRTWLNTEFYQSAFSEQERTAIRSVTVKHAADGENPETAPPDTIDRLYLLSADEAVNEAYGFVSGKQRQRDMTEYAALASRTNELVSGWWLRTPGHEAGRIRYVAGENGAINFLGCSVDGYCGVCPVLQLDLSKVEISEGSHIVTIRTPKEEEAATTESSIRDEDLYDSDPEHPSSEDTDPSITEQDGEDTDRSGDNDPETPATEEKQTGQAKTGATTECPHNNTYLKGVREASAATDGYSGDTWCSDCGRRIAYGTTVPKGQTAPTTAAPSTQAYTGYEADPPAVTPVTTEASPQTEAATVSQSTTQTPGLITVSGSVYRVTSWKKTGSTAQYVRPVKKTRSSVKIPATITWNDRTLKVTSIAPKAFRNNKSLRKVDIGKQVKKIGKQAFYNCKNLEKLTIRSKKLTSSNVGSKAFYGINDDVRVLAPAKKVNAYQKLLIRKGLYQ